MNRDDSDVTHGILSYLRGYGRHNPEGLAAIATYGDWPAMAGREYERRMARILESLPLDEVQAIAVQDIELNQLACQVLGELNKE